MGIITLLYLLNVYQGMLKRDPVSAPTGTSTVGIVSTFAGIGAGISLISALWSKTWIPASGLVLNAAALAIWRYWITSGMLLPYEQWLDKVGMP